MRSSLINRAVAMYRSGDRVAIEYPLLPDDTWHALGDDFSPFTPLTCLGPIALALDFLHLSGVVHGDMKPSNFMYRNTPGGPELRLIDLDFLLPSGHSPEADIFGTPGHIAPEILANQTVLPQSDAYSLGVALHVYLRAEGHALSAEHCRELSGLADELSDPDYLKRPNDLLAALRRHEIVDQQSYELLSARLFGQFVLSNFRSIRGLRSHKTPEIDNFLRRRCRLLGITETLIRALSASAAKDYRTTRKIIGGLLSHSAVSRAGAHYLISPDDHVLLDTYARLGAVVQSDHSPAHQELPADEFYRAEKWSEAAFLHSYRRATENESAVSAGPDTIINLASEAYNLNRLIQAESLLDSVLFDECSVEAHLLSLQLVLKTKVKLGHSASARQLAEMGIAIARRKSDLHSELLFIRTLAWISMLGKDQTDAEAMVDEVRQRSQQAGFTDVEAMAEYTAGVLHWREGRFLDAAAHLGKAVALSEPMKTEVLVPALSTLALVKTGLSDYKGAARVAKNAINMASELEQGSLLSPNCLVLILAYVRLGDINKADYWLRRFYVEIANNANPGQLLHYHQISAFCALWRGEVKLAEEACSHALEIARSIPPTSIVGKAYHVLAECALIRGDMPRLSSALESARQLLAQYKDATSLAELDMIQKIGDLVYARDIDPASVYPIIDVLLERGSFFYAALGLFQIVVSGQSVDENMRARRDRLSAVISDHDVPVFRVLSTLLYPSDIGQRGDEVKGWKSAFVELNQAGDRFRAMLIAIEVSAFYIEGSRARSAKKYLLQARQIAKQLQNTLMQEKIEASLAKLALAADEQTHLIDSFHGISSILKDVHDYPKMMYQLVRYAVEQTGAERGVILLNTGNAAGLRPAVSYNCDDDQSMADILDFSRSIPRTAATDSLPILVENAIQDNRTRSLKSVIAHNILSVAAVPLTVEGQVLGVLYLDHHTIPSLFEPSDIQYIQAIANLVAVALSNAQSYRILLTKSDQLEKRLVHLGESGQFISRDPKTSEIFEQLDRIAQTTAPVLLLGESGTGKEIIAERVHSLSPRCKRNMVKLNCAGLAPTMVESELFGVAKGVATGVIEREGRLAAADSGTLFLDEIGDMPLEVQAKLLRVVEYQEYEKVGSNRPVHTDIRFVCATNKNLMELMDCGRFRQDLYYRINTVTVEIPPLRERPGDIPLLTDHFLQLFSRGQAPILTPETMGLLSTYSWPGNVRQLKRLIESWCILMPGRAITPNVLPAEITKSTRSLIGSAAIANMEEVQIREALRKANGNQSRAARSLAMPLTTLRRKAYKYHIEL